MKKYLGLSVLLSTTLLQATQINLSSGIKEYTNSKTKVDGTTTTVGIIQQIESSTISFNYTKDSVDRENKVTLAPLTTLNVKKYNLNYNYKIDENFTFKLNYIKILDNLAPTDQGKVYGIGLDTNISKGLKTTLKYYKSDYATFNVNQYDLALSKAFMVDEFKSKVQIVGKYINIDGVNYASYSFKDKNYTTVGIKLGTNYQGYYAGVGSFFGKRMFSVMDDGLKVQHHAMEQNKTYMINIGKKFENFDIALAYSYQNGKELPENQDDVDTKVTTIKLNYKF